MGNLNLPTNSGQLIGLATKNIEGMELLAAALKLSLITTAQMQANLAAFVAQDNAFNAARSARQTASDAYGAATGAVYDWLLGVSNTLATRYGTRWNTQWAQAGFVNNTTSIPTKIEDRLGLALALVGFFTANPSYEVPNLDQTAAFGATLRTAALGAQSAVMTATVALNTAGATWQTAYDALVKGMRSLINNLNDVLAKDDPRWLCFGLQMPATVTTPGKPLNLSAHLDGTGAIVLQCDAPPLATRFRWRMRLVGAQASFQLVASTTEPMASVPGVSPGQTAEFIVQAVNAGLQGVPSDPVTFTTLLTTPTKAALKAPPTVTMELPARDNSAASPAPAAGHHGNGNGHGNGHAAAPRVG